MSKLLVSQLALLVPPMLFAFAACSPTPSPRPIDPAVGAGCVEACAHVNNAVVDGGLGGCDGVLQPKKGTCVEACETAERNGVDFCTAHLAGARDCAQVHQVANNGCE
jgi:hypothetical protein